MHATASPFDLPFNYDSKIFAMMNKIAMLALGVGLTFGSLSARVFPLSENSWSNPEFVKRFLGTYGFDTAVTPSISTIERTLFETISPLIADRPTEAIAALELALTPESSGAIHYTIANLYFQSGNEEKAKVAYEEAIRRFPSFLRAYRNLGTLHIQRGEFEPAVKHLLKSIELGAQGSDVYGLIGYSYLSLGNAAAALRAYEQALFFAPDSRDWRMGQIQSLSTLGRHTEVIGMIDQLLEEFPEQSELLMLQANAFIATDQREDAAATLEILRSRDAGTSASLVLLGDLYLSFQQPDLALESYREAVLDHELSADRILKIARRLASSRSWTEVDHFVAAAQESGMEGLSPEEEINFLNLMAQSDLAQNRAAAAAERLEQVVARDPMNGEALVLLADYHWQENEIERAETYYQRATQVPATAPDALVQHARMLVSVREFGRAEGLLERAQMLNPRGYVGQYLEQVASAARSAAR